ncbi:MAG: ABC transporter transmembrane domain-containing protein, partial [Chlamydiota bacterium]
KHLSLLIVTFVTLIALTVASQLEMFALGILSHNGADFFALFSSGKKVESTNPLDQRSGVEAISLQQVEKQWSLIDKEGTGSITKQQAAAYMSQKKDENPLNWLIRKVKDRFAFTSNVNALIFALVCVAVFKAIWLFASRYTTQILAIRISRDLRQQYFEHIQTLPMSFYQKHNIGSLSSRIVGDAGQIATSINSWLTNYLQTPFTVITCLSMCVYLSWQLSIVIFIGVPLIISPIVFLARRVKRVSRQLQSNQERFANVLIDFLAGIQTVKIASSVKDDCFSI